MIEQGDEVSGNRQGGEGQLLVPLLIDVPVGSDSYRVAGLRLHK